MICRECHEDVEAYHPTGTASGTRRAIRHPESAYAPGGWQCPGSFGPVDRPVERPRYPRPDGGPSVREFQQSKGEA
jgi:hypothetical protein